MSDRVHDRVHNRVHRRAAAAAVTAGAAIAALVLAAVALVMVVVVLTRSGPAASAGASAVVTCADDRGDSARIQQALDASRPGDAVTVRGPCLLTRTVVLPDERTLQGAARGDSRTRTGTVLTQADGANLPALIASASWRDDAPTVSSGQRVQRLMLDGDAAHNHGTVGLLLRGWRSRVDDVEIADMPGDGIRISNPGAHGRLLTNTLGNSSITDSFVHDVGGADLRVVDPGNAVTDWTVAGNWFAGAGSSGIALDNAAGWQIRGNHLYGITGDGIAADRCFGTTISDNEIEDFGRPDPSAVAYGIRCTVQPGTPSTIVGNRVTHPSGTTGGPLVYLDLAGAAAGDGYAVLADNAVLGTGAAGDTGVAIDAGAARLTVVSHGNLVADVGTAQRTSGAVELGAGS